MQYEACRCKSFLFREQNQIDIDIKQSGNMEIDFPDRDGVKQRKIWAWLESLPENKEFRDKIATIREQCDIPLEGYEEVKTVEVEGNTLITLPDDLASSTSFSEKTKQLAKELGLPAYLWQNTIQYYVAYNRWLVDSAGSLLQVSNLDWELNGPFQYEGEQEGMTNYIKMRAKHNPVALHISPYASQRDILKFVKENYEDEIKPLQEKHQKDGVGIGKARKKSSKVQERNEIIYKLSEEENMTGKEISEVIADEFGDVLDYTYINKIIRDEKRKKEDFNPE